MERSKTKMIKNWPFKSIKRKMSDLGTIHHVAHKFKKDANSK